MIKEMALGLQNRHHFIDISKVSQWQRSSKDTFTSLYDYDEYVKKYVKDNGKLSGYDGLIYMPDEFILDVDGSSPGQARNLTIALTLLLKDLMVPYNIYFSGTGFHVGIPSSAFRWKPDKNLHTKVKQALKHAGIFEYADPSVTDKTRLIRLNLTRNSKSGYWKTCIKEEMLHGEISAILEVAQLLRKNNVTPQILECEPVFDVFAESKTEEKAFVESNKPIGKKPDPINYPCITTMEKGMEYGSRHATALRLASWYRWRHQPEQVSLLMEHWRNTVDTKEKPFSSDEMAKIVKDCYDGHGGAGYRYGCNDPIMDKHCKNTCRIYKAKASHSIMGAEAHEKEMINFYTGDTKGINLGEPYGQNFPVYPGEVVIIQAPPKSMKTMLLQNWVHHFKSPTYFMEMEMSPRQMWGRFVQINKGWNEEELKAHYMAMRNGISEGFNWLTMDYSSCYPMEIEKRLTMLNMKPEIVVIDHMGLLRSKKVDNSKVEEASQALMELAVQHNLIVFAVSEITKQAFYEGMNLASSRGSFRIAYNANKVISISPTKVDGLITQLHVKTEANREKENLDIRLWVQGVQIKGVEKAAYEQIDH